MKDKTERAAAFYVLNRASFSGTILSGGMSPNHPRFTESCIERLESFHVDHFHVECVDYQIAIKSHPDAFLYLDPPYMNGKALYGVRGDAHIGFNHEALAELLSNRNRWIMSYNDIERVRILYKDYPIINIEWTYGMSKDKRSKEVLIFSKDLNLPTYSPKEKSPE